jgi:5-methylcytosine-specific restriction endonuclease McrA
VSIDNIARIFRIRFPSPECKLVMISAINDGLRNPPNFDAIADFACVDRSAAERAVDLLRYCGLLAPSLVEVSRLQVNEERLELLCNGGAWFVERDHGWRIAVDPDALTALRAMVFADAELERIRREQEYRKAFIPAALRREIIDRDERRCRACGAEDHLTVDHIYPERHGGTLDPNNLQCLCKSCNSSKGALILPGVPKL